MLLDLDDKDMLLAAKLSRQNVKWTLPSNDNWKTQNYAEVRQAARDTVLSSARRQTASVTTCAPARSRRVSSYALSPTAGSSRPFNSLQASIFLRMTAPAVSACSEEGLKLTSFYGFHAHLKLPSFRINGSDLFTSVEDKSYCFF